MRFIIAASKSLYLKKVETDYYRLGLSKEFIGGVEVVASWAREEGTTLRVSTCRPLCSPTKILQIQPSFSLSSNYYRLL